MPTIEEAKTRLNLIIGKSRVDLYKPIHIAEVLHRSRTVGDFDVAKLETYQNPSLRWRNEVTNKLAGKVSISSARYQHDVWNVTAMPTEILAVLDAENKATSGAVEKYIYSRYGERQGTVSSVISAIKEANSENFKLETLLELFIKELGIRRSIDKAYEIVVYSLFETVISALEAKVKVSVAETSKPLLQEFSDLAKVLLGVEENKLSWEQTAHIFRVGVTNAADRGLDMWANFGVAVQVKHLTLNEKLASSIAGQVESDSIVIVCKDAEAKVIETVLKQIGYGARVRGIVKESDLVKWYEKCLRGKFSDKLAQPLLERLLNGFEAEFPFSTTLAEFLEERGYDNLEAPEFWRFNFMKLAKTFIVFTFFLVFPVYVSAQNNPYPNEIEGYEFFKSGRFSDLKLLASDRDDVKAIFGEKCDNGCDYDEGWEIRFSYVNSGWSRKFTENGKEQIYRPKPEFVGKLAGISFRPKKTILLSESVVIPKEIICSVGTAYGVYTYKVRSCIDDKRVNYNISDETIKNGKIVKGQITSINYVPSKKEDDEIFALVEK